MQDRKWVFTQKQRNLRVTGKTVGGVRSPVCPFFSPPFPFGVLLGAPVAPPGVVKGIWERVLSNKKRGYCV